MEYLEPFLFLKEGKSRILDFIRISYRLFLFSIPGDK